MVIIVRPFLLLSHAQEVSGDRLVLFVIPVKEVNVILLINYLLFSPILIPLLTVAIEHKHRLPDIVLRVLTNEKSS